jgi:hypothetical protein
VGGGLGWSGARRVEHGDREVGEHQGERRQRHQAVGAGLAVPLPAGQAAVEEPHRQRDAAGGLRLRQVAQMRHHEIEQFRRGRLGALPRRLAGGLDVAVQPQRLVRQQQLGQARPVRRGAAQHLGRERLDLDLDQLAGRALRRGRQPGDEMQAVLRDRDLVPCADGVDQPGARCEVIGDRRPVVLAGGGDYLSIRHLEPPGGEQFLGSGQQAQPSFAGPPGGGTARRAGGGRRGLSHIFKHYAQHQTDTHM